MKEKRLIVLIMLCIFTFAVSAQAEKFEGTSMGGERLERMQGEDAVLPGRWWEMPRVQKELGLTAEEKTKLDSLHYDYRGKMIDLKGDVSKAQLELEQVLNSESMDEANAKSKFRALLDARNRMAEARFAHLLKVRQVLGSDRFQKIKRSFRELMNKKRDRHGMRKGAEGERDSNREEKP